MVMAFTECLQVDIHGKFMASPVQLQSKELFTPVQAQQEFQDLDSLLVLSIRIIALRGDRWFLGGNLAVSAALPWWASHSTHIAKTTNFMFP